MTKFGLFEKFFDSQTMFFEVSKHSIHLIDLLILILSSN